MKIFEERIGRLGSNYGPGFFEEIQINDLGKGMNPSLPSSGIV